MCRYNRTLGGPPGSVPQLNSQPNPHEVIEPFNRYKSMRKAQLQPNMDTADVKTLEKDLVLRESTTGKFSVRQLETISAVYLQFYILTESADVCCHVQAKTTTLTSSCKSTNSRLPPGKSLPF